MNKSFAFTYVILILNANRSGMVNTMLYVTESTAKMVIFLFA